MEQKKKKPYSKPEIIFESFTLSTSIAVCDTREQNFTGFPDCGFINAMGQSVFTTSYVSACHDVRKYNENYDDPIAGHVCWYNSGGDPFNLHSS